MEKKLVKLQEMHSRLSNRPIVNILFRVATVVPVCTAIQSALGLRNKSEVDQETLFAILRLLSLPSMAKNFSSIYSNHWGC